MTKSEKYRLLHRKISDIVGISPAQVETIRSYILGYNKTPQEIREWALYKSTLPRVHTGRLATKYAKTGIGKRDKSKKYYIEIAEFIRTAKESSLNYLNREVV